MPPSLPQSEQKKILLTAVLLLVLTGAWTVFGPYGALRYYRVSKELRLVEERNEQLRTANQTLRTEITKLTKDPAYLEKVAREEFGLIKKNEVVYEFPERKKKRE
jgi:cell division protein FtsB